jgi:hypothetical protein
MAAPRGTGEGGVPAQQGTAPGSCGARPHSHRRTAPLVYVAELRLLRRDPVEQLVERGIVLAR